MATIRIHRSLWCWRLEMYTVWPIKTWPRCWTSTFGRLTGCCSLQHAISQQALKVLEEERDAQGRRFKVTKVPTPPPLYITQEEEAGTKVIPIHSRYRFRVERHQPLQHAEGLACFISDARYPLPYELPGWSCNAMSVALGLAATAATQGCPTLVSRAGCLLQCHAWHTLRLE